ncbi:MAG: hypothetical protein MJ090_00810 [Clostridia bacterium]|nr:hypothetical protein [Clostridia bacterium]
MIEKLKEITEKYKNPKTLVIIGVVGIIFIAAASFFSGENTGVKSENSVFDTEEYRKTLEKEVSGIVYGITGDKRSTVVVTLQNGIRYSYADDTKTDSDLTDTEKTKQSRKSSQSSHITVKDSNGEEKALVVTENMPEIRGVAIICENGEQEYLAEKIKSAVIAALDITSKRVYITGKN